MLYYLSAYQCLYLLHFMYQVMGEYGYSIEHILMVDIIPDPAVRKAMNEINAGNIYYSMVFRAFFIFMAISKH